MEGSFTTENFRFLLAAAYQCIRAAFDDVAPAQIKDGQPGLLPPASEVPALLRGTSPFLSVAVVVRVGARIRGHAIGRGATLFQQLSTATQAAIRDRIRGPIVFGELDQCRLDVWLQTSCDAIDANRRLEFDALNLYEDGAEIRWNDIWMSYSPFQVSHHNVRSPQALFEKLCEDAQLFLQAWKDPLVTVLRTTWLRINESTHGEIIRSAANTAKVVNTVTERLLQQWIDEGLDYFLRNEEAGGGYRYLYDALTDKTPQSASNSVRNAGAAYGVARTLSYVSGQRRASGYASLRRCVSSQQRTALPVGVDGLYLPDQSNAQTVVAAPFGKLGATALLAASLLHAPDAGSEDLLSGLLQGLLEQVNEDGSFNCFFYSDRDAAGATHYYPGEALLALALNAQFKRIDLEFDFAKSFETYRNLFRQDPSTAFVGWHALVWSKVALLEDRQDYAAFVFEQIDWLLQFQLQTCFPPQWSGGFSMGHAVAPGITTSVYTEATIIAMQLAKIWDDNARWRRYRNAAVSGLRFCSQLRLDRSQTVLFANPERAVGGFSGSLSDRIVRSDHVQHGVTCAIAALETGLFDG